MPSHDQGVHKRSRERVLRGQYQYQKGPVKLGRGRKPVYGMVHKELLLEAWVLLGCPCSRRLEVAMPDVVDNLERHKCWKLELSFKQELLRMSHGTMDRLLSINRKRLRPFGRSITKPGHPFKEPDPDLTRT